MLNLWLMTYLCNLKAIVLKKVQEDRKSLSLRNIEHFKFVGLYAIWYRHRCLYVGQSERQTVYSRLYAHLSDCHNERLRLWIRVKDGALCFTSSLIDDEDVDSIRGIENYLIRVLDPETNKQRPGGANG